MFLIPCILFVRNGYNCTGGKHKNCPCEWKFMQSLTSKDLTSSDNARVSDSENGFNPAKYSEQGSFEAPASKIHFF